jgi:uncharacterized protein (DUF1501 family)
MISNQIGITTNLLTTNPTPHTPHLNHHPLPHPTLFMNRRHFLQTASCFAAGSVFSVGAHGWFARSEAAPTHPKRLIVVFLRGAVDGLNVVVPYTDAGYYGARSKIAIAPPGKAGGVLDLNGQFGLHPSLEMLMPLWTSKNLAFVHACGSPDGTRSHFDAQDYMESGTPGIKSTPDGWMNRLLASLTTGRNPIQAVNVGTTTPRILVGKASVATIASGRNADAQLAIDRPQVSAAFDRLYNRNDTLSRAYKDSREARQALMAEAAEMKMANNGAPLPNGFAKDAQRLARVMVNDPRVELGFLALGGWDSHTNQGGSQGQLARNLQQLGRGLAALQTGLGSAFANTTILVMSEFGRTVRENGNGGTDHGHGNVMWVLGGNLKDSISGGNIHGNWRGLATAALHEGRDLPVTTDFRAVVTRVLERQMRLTDTQLRQVFPNYTPSTIG